MADAGNGQVLRRMVAPADGSGEAGKSPWTGVWQVIVPRAADEVIGVETGLVRARQKEQTLPKLLDGLPDGGMILRLEAPNGGDGLAHLDSNVLASLLEAQTLGRILPSAAPDRKGTRTDAAITAPQIDRWIEAAEKEAGARSEPPPPWHGLRVSVRLEDRRAVELAVDEGRFSVNSLELAFGGSSAKVGTLTLASRSAGNASRSAGATGQIGLTETVFAANATLKAVLDRPKVSIGWVNSLSEGDFLEIPRDRLHSVRVEAVDGARIADARLGQIDGDRAIRIDLKGYTLPPAKTASMEFEPDPTEPSPLDAMHDLPAVDAEVELPQLSNSTEDTGEFPDLPDLPDGDALPDLPEISDPQGIPDLPDLQD